MCAFLLFVIIAATARVEADRRMFAAMFGGSKK